MSKVAVNLGAEILGAEFSDITADLLFISYIFSNYGVTENVLSDAEKSWSEFSRLKRTYDQIRYIDEDGNEVVRVNYI